MRRSKTHDVMNYYVTIVNKDSPSVVKNLMKLTTRGEKDHCSRDLQRCPHGIYEVGIPASQERVFDFVNVIGDKSVIEWIMERYAITTDKASGIVNDPNAWAEEHGNPRYILGLLLSVITVSMKTMDIVETLLKFE